MSNGKHYPARRYGGSRRYYPARRQQAQNQNFSVFQGNMANNMRFGNKGDDLSAYVFRRLVMIDKEGNRQYATEEQFFNSGKKIGAVRIGKRGESNF